jgi:hypothetical protein
MVTDNSTKTEKTTEEVPENLHEILMARAVYEEAKIAEIKVAFDANNTHEVIKLTGELLYAGPGAAK